MSAQAGQMKQASGAPAGRKRGSFGMVLKAEGGMETQSSGTLQSSTLTSHTDDSSKSTGSKLSEVEITEKDRDLSKDNAASPIDLECIIQEERITKILDEALYKTKLVLCLPKLVNNRRILNEILSPAHMKDLESIFEHYNDPLFTDSLIDMSMLENIRNGDDICFKHRVNPELSHLLYFLSEYPRLKPIVEEMTIKMKDQYIELRMENSQHAPDPMLEYLIVFELFREKMIKQMQTTAAEELAEKLRVRNLEESNTKNLNKIEELEDLLETEQKRFEAVMSGKQQIIDELEKELEQLNIAAEAKLKKKVRDSDCKMVLMSREHVIKNEILKEVEADTRESYKSLLDHHLIAEKNQRARRLKVQSQLINWIQKYDTEMAEKQIDLSDMELKYKDEIARIEELKVLIEEQNVEYIPLMAEREEEYQAEMLGKLRALQLEHAARVIQNTWRRVLQNRAEKRKLRALWKKKKAEIERQERIADRQMQKEAEAARKAAKKEKKKNK